MLVLGGGLHFPVLLGGELLCPVVVLDIYKRTYMHCRKTIPDTQAEPINISKIILLTA
jgi:hypothetical protein